MQSNITTTESPKLRINTTVQVYDTVELSLDLPYFCKSSDAFWKIVSQDKAVRVSTYSSCVMILDPTHSHNAKDIASSVIVNESDFNAALQTALDNIQKTAA
jgi:hypothetical protein